jgi:hypothetical protein
MQKDKLQQCPFCGCKVHNRFAVKGMFTVICSGDDCGAVVSFLDTHKKSAVASKYNKRYTGEEPSFKRSINDE